MRLRTTGYGNAKSVEVYVRIVVARAANGGERKYFSELIAPECSSTSGVLPTIPISEIFAEDLMHRPGFRVLMITTDAIPTNKSAARMLIAELQIYPQLIILPAICSSHTLRNATKWGLGEFPYGLYLRTSQGLGAVRCRNFGERVDKMLRFAAPDGRVSFGVWNFRRLRRVYPKCLHSARFQFENHTWYRRLRREGCDA